MEKLLEYVYQLRPQGRTRYRYLKQLLQTQWLPPEELRAMQLQRIQHLVEHAYTYVPFYTERFRQAGIHPRDIRTLEDFSHIPVLTREDLRNNMEALLATNIPRETMELYGTSGSTGEPVHFYCTTDRVYWNWAAWTRVWSWFGAQPNCKRAWVRNVRYNGREPLSWRLRTWLHREKWLDAMEMDAESARAFAIEIARFKPALLIGYYSSLWKFAQFVEQDGIKGIAPQAVIGGGEKLYDFQRELIERVFGCPCVDCYSCNEVSTISAECPEGGMHVAAEVRYVEVVQDDRPALPGEVGELVVTDLVNEGMPFIRYQIGDLARATDQICSCGRGLPLLGEVTGRTVDFLTAPDGEIVSGFYFMRQFKDWPGVHKFQVRQVAPDRIDVLVQGGDEVDAASMESRKRTFEDRFGGSVQFSMHKVEDIPLTAGGKHLFVIPFSADHRSGMEAAQAQQRDDE